MTRGGALLDYERSEALWNHCALALFTGASDFACAGRFLEMARNFGNPRATAGALLMCGIRNPDIARGLELLAEARELATQSRDSYRYAVATGWLGVLQSTVDPPAVLRLLPDLVRHARTTGQHLLLVQITRDCMHPLARLGRFEAVATLDGLSLQISSRPSMAAAATEQARVSLGVKRYEARASAGAALSRADI
jgi:hypothetical protein